MNKNLLLNINKISTKIFFYILFSVSFLFFLKDKIRNPFDIQQIIIMICLTCIFFNFLFKNIFLEKIKRYNFLFLEKILIYFFIICFISFIIAFFKFKDIKFAIFNEGIRLFPLLIFNTILNLFAQVYIIY